MVSILLKESIFQGFNRKHLRCPHLYRSSLLTDVHHRRSFVCTPVSLNQSEASIHVISQSWLGSEFPRHNQLSREYLMRALRETAQLYSDTRKGQFYFSSLHINPFTGADRLSVKPPRQTKSLLFI